MKHYETPELNSVYFDVKNRIMDDPYDFDGDTGDNPWEDLFRDSDEDAQGLLD